MPRYPQVTKADALGRFKAALESKFQRKVYRTEAYITTVTRDDGGRAVSCVATIDGVAQQQLQIGYGSVVAAGDVFLVANAGATTSPYWVAERRIQSSYSLPPLDPGATLPAPTGLNLITWAEPPRYGGGYGAHIFAYWTTIGDQYGAMLYDVQGRLNDPDPDNPYVFELTIVDEQPHTTTDGAMTNAQLIIPLTATAATIPRQGRIQIDLEKIDYTAATGATGDSGVGGVGALNTFTVAGETWAINAWKNYILRDSAAALFVITANTGTVLTISGTPANGAWAIVPGLSGCTRAAGGTAAATHLDDAGVYFLTTGATIHDLVPNTDYNVRVRARSSAGAISAWTAWASIETDIDVTAPPDPTGFTAVDDIGGIRLAWTGPLVGDVPDLAGYNLYRATDTAGTGAALETVLPIGTSAFYVMGTGDWGYWNLKAFDTSGNESGYAVVTWDYAISLPGAGVNILTNSDFERDRDANGVADDWETGGTGALTLGAYGLDGTKGYRMVLDDEEAGILYWRPYTNTYHVIAEELDYSATVYFKTTVASTLFDYSNVTATPDGDLGINAVAILCADGTSFVLLSTWITAREVYPLGNDWYRLWFRMRPATAQFGSYPYIGFKIHLYNRTAGTVTVDIDRPQLERAPRPSEWRLCNTPPGFSAAKGLSVDVGGIVDKAANFHLSSDGKMYSPLIFKGTSDALNTVFLDTYDADASMFGLWSSAGANPVGVRRNVWMVLGYNSNAAGAIDAAEYRWHTLYESHWNPDGTPVMEYYLEAIEPAGSTVTRPIFVTTTKAAALGTIITLSADTINVMSTKDALQVMTFTLGATLATSGLLSFCPIGVRITNTDAFRVENVGSDPVFVVDTTNGNAYSTGKLGNINPAAYAAGVVAEYISTGATVYPNGMQAAVRKYQAVAGEYVTGALIEAASYASTGDSSVTVQTGVSAIVVIDAANGRTATVGYAAAFVANSPTISGAGTHAFTQLDGVRINNQGNAHLTTSHGLKIEGQSGSTTTYAIYTGTGINYLGDQTRIYQPAADGAVPPLLLSQADDDQDMIEFTGTVGVGNCIEAVGAKTLTTTHFVKVTITGVGERYIPVGTIA